MDNVKKLGNKRAYSSSLGLAMDKDDWVGSSNAFGWLQPLDIHLLAKDVASDSITCIAATGIEEGTDRSDL